MARRYAVLMKRKRRVKKNPYVEVRAYADHQLATFRRKANSLVARELAKLRVVFATKENLKNAVKRLETADADLAHILRDFVQQVEDRFERLDD
jgi:hypothetical protein